MLRIRLRRQGGRKQPTYRIVVTDQRAARDGRFVEIIGHYNPRTEPSVATVDEERAYYWLGNGAQPSDAVNRIFGWTGTLDRFARVKKGEDITELIKESVDAAEGRPNPTITRHAAPEKSLSKKKSKDDAVLDDDNVREDSAQEPVGSSEEQVEISDEGLEEEEKGNVSDDNVVDSEDTTNADSKADVSSQDDKEANGDVGDAEDVSDQTQEANSNDEEDSSVDVSESSNESVAEKSDKDEKQS